MYRLAGIGFLVVVAGCTRKVAETGSRPTPAASVNPAESQSMNPPAVPEQQGPVGRTWSVRETISADSQPMVFTLVGESASPTAPTMTVRAIEIRRGGDPEPIQRLEGFQTEIRLDESGFVIEDMNFDGWRDIRLARGSHGEERTYLCWLYDPETGQYARSEALEQLTEPEFDAQTKTIHAGGSHGKRQTYSWRNGRLTPPPR